MVSGLPDINPPLVKLGYPKPLWGELFGLSDMAICPD